MTNFKYISYLEACFQNNRLIRWPDNTMPLKIHVAPFRWYKEKDNDYEYYSMIKDALEIWQKASQGKVKFEFVANLYQSNINIEWKRVERTSLANCSFNFDATGRLYSAEISIGLSDGIIHKKYQDKGEVFHTITHEVGHALGLNHSPFPEDIMYVPHQYGVINISRRDATTLKWLYKFPYGITKQEIISHYKASSDYGVDGLIYALETDRSKPDNPIAEIAEEKEQLHNEQRTLSELGKFNISIQNIKVSKDVEEYFKKFKQSNHKPSQ